MENLTVKERSLRLFSLDGGGIRGLAELCILGEIMNRLQGELKLDHEPTPADYFDLMGGTSTGGLSCTTASTPENQIYPRNIDSGSEKTGQDFQSARA